MKTKTITIKTYSDASHGWGKFSLARLKRLVPEVIDKISQYSYMTNTSVFLEEDCDLPLVVEALQAKGYEVDFDEVGTAWKRRSAIRRYGPYVPHFVRNPIGIGSRVCVRGWGTGTTYIVTGYNKERKFYSFQREWEKVKELDKFVFRTSAVSPTKSLTPPEEGVLPYQG